MSIIKFYKKDRQSNRIFLASLFVVLSLISLHHFYSLGSQIQKKQDLKIIHYSLANVLSLNLQKSCDLFVLDEPLKSLRSSLKKKGYGLDLVKKELTSINKLKYEKIFMRTYSLSANSKSPEISHTSHGYLVSHLESLNCFGLL